MKAVLKPAIISALVFVGLFLLASGKVVYAYGESGPAPTCTNLKPEKPLLYHAERVGSNQVNLAWGQSAMADSWTLAYGVESGKYIYGLDRFGNSESRGITVGNLPGGRYYFVVRANHGCMPGPFSNEKMVDVGAAQTPATGPVTYQPQPTTPTTPRTPTTPGRPGTRITPPTEPDTMEEEGVTEPTRPTTPPPAPQRQGLFQQIINFFRNLFGG